MSSNEEQVVNNIESAIHCKAAVLITSDPV